jgi:FkbM family methyltransferase
MPKWNTYASLYSEYIKKNIDGTKNYITNPMVLFKTEGIIKLKDGQLFSFNKYNKTDIINLVIFILKNGIIFNLNNKYSWKFYPLKGIIKTPDGIKLSIKGFEPIIISETFLNDIHFVDFDLRGKIIIDAGGFTGDTALYYANKGAKVYSFEPDANSYEIAKYNLCLNPSLYANITFKNYALGKDGEIDFPINIKESSGGSSIYSNNNTKHMRKIDSLSLNSVIKKFKIINPYLLHLDVKGCEFDLIKNSSISNFKRVRIEYSSYLLKGKNKNPEYLIKMLKKYNFTNIRVYKHNCLRYDLSYHGTIDAVK